jgi:flavin-dependent dehydrogenase
LDSFNGKTSPVLRKSYDVVVVGARIAGSTLAALLDGSGLSILFERRFSDRIAAHEGLGQRVGASRPVDGMFGCGPERGYVRVPYGPGWALVGDAGLHRDPWTGLGIDMAAVHATFLAETLRAGESLATYHERRDERALEAYRRTTRLAADLHALSD